VALALSATGCGLLLDPAPPRGGDASARPRDAGLDAPSMDAAASDAWVEPEMDAWTPADATMDAWHDDAPDARFVMPRLDGYIVPDAYAPDAFELDAPPIACRNDVTCPGGTFCDRPTCAGSGFCRLAETGCAGGFEPACDCTSTEVYASVCEAQRRGHTPVRPATAAPGEQCFGNGECGGGECLGLTCERGMMLPGTCFRTTGCCRVGETCAGGAECLPFDLPVSATVTLSVGYCAPMMCIAIVQTTLDPCPAGSCCVEGMGSRRVIGCL